MTGNFELNSLSKPVAANGDISDGLDRQDLSHPHLEPERVLTSEVEEFNPMALPTIASVQQTDE